MSQEHPNVVEKALTWLRGGYPTGVPKQDYVALLGILHHKLSDEELRQVVAELEPHEGEPITREEIAEAVETRTHQKATDEDIERVTRRLVTAGWDEHDLPAATVDEDPAA